MTSALTRDYAAGSKVCEAITGRFDGEVRLMEVSDQVATVEVSVNAAPGGANCARSFGDAAATYDGRELFDLPPDWKDGIGTGFSQVRDTIDLARGVTDFVLPQDFTSRVLDLSYWIRDDATLEAVVGLFYRMRGAQKAFYVPASAQSLAPVLPIAAGVNVVFTGSDLYDA